MALRQAGALYLRQAEAQLAAARKPLLRPGQRRGRRKLRGTGQLPELPQLLGNRAPDTRPRECLKLRCCIVRVVVTCSGMKMCASGTYILRILRLQQRMLHSSHFQLESRETVSLVYTRELWLQLEGG